MSYAAITAEIKTIVETAANTANVYEYLRYVSKENDYKTLFQNGTTINTWQISRVAVVSEFGGTDGNVDKTHEFAINGFYSLDDSAASEKVFQQIVDNVMDQFDLKTNSTLNGSVSHMIRPSQLEVFANDMYGSVGGHVCEIKIFPVELVVNC